MTDEMTPRSKLIQEIEAALDRNLKGLTLGDAIGVLEMFKLELYVRQSISGKALLRDKAQITKEDLSL